MVSHPPAHTNGPGLTLLPFGGLGLDLAEVRRKVSGLLLTPFRKQEAHEPEPRFDAPPVLSGYGLLLRLCRETLGS
jgi:hypothetical protein